MAAGATGKASLASALRETLAALAAAAADARTLDQATRRELLAEVDRASGVLATVRAGLRLAERESGAWRGSGDPSFAAWRGRTTREGLRGGVAEERRAETLGTVPGLLEATAAGDVSVAHVDVVGRTAGAGSSAVRRAIRSPEGQQRVVEMARRLDAGRFNTAMARWAAGVDADALERGHQGQRAARFLHLADAPDGTRINGRLDRMAGHRLRLALEALSPRPAADDDRSEEQRKADALESMADKILALPETVPGAAQRPHVSFLMTEESWAAVRARRRSKASGATTSSGTGTAATSPAMDAPVTPPVTLEDGTPVPMSEVARILCDCELTRIVLDAASEPIDLGRTARTYTGTQRRGVIARDAGCAWAGCGMAPRWLEVHHSRWWDRDDGPTSVKNGVAVCSFHHHEIHRRDLTIERIPLDPGEIGATTRRVRYVLTGPDGRVIAGARREESAVPDPPGDGRAWPEAPDGDRAGPPPPGGRRAGPEPPRPRRAGTAGRRPDAADRRLTARMADGHADEPRPCSTPIATAWGGS